MPKLLNNPNSAAGILRETKAEALWDLEKPLEALDAQVEAATRKPKSFKTNLRLARFYATLGQSEKANETIKSLAKEHKHALLPERRSPHCLYKRETPKRQNQC